MKRIRTLASIVSTAIAMCGAAPVLADDHTYSEGEVVNISKIRTENGHFDDYMKYLDTTWKTEQEAYKKAGLITNSRGGVEIIDRPRLEEAACECYDIMQRKTKEWQEA